MTLKTLVRKIEVCPMTAVSQNSHHCLWYSDVSGAYQERSNCDHKECQKNLPLTLWNWVTFVMNSLVMVMLMPTTWDSSQHNSHLLQGNIHPLMELTMRS